MPRTPQKLKYPFSKKNGYEQLAWSDQQLVVGIDEVGRGALVGPVVAAAVILPQNCSYRSLKDSKLMTSEERVRADRWIKNNCYYAYGMVHHRYIDKHNIWQATLMAMQKAVMHLLTTIPKPPKYILTDAMPLILRGSNYQEIEIHHFPFGEKRSSSIAAASIIAKVKRDAILKEMHQSFPHFNWNSNKGYGTEQHKIALAQYNRTITHRLTYIEDIDNHTNHEDDYNYGLQSTIF